MDFALYVHSIDLTVNTTKRTIVLMSLVRESQEGELLPTSLSGGHLRRNLTLESYLWLDKERDPEGALTWTSSMGTYASARASERVFVSSLVHPSISKVGFAFAYTVSGNIGNLKLYPSISKTGLILCEILKHCTL